MTMPPSETHYRGRLAPSPTGYLHLGHARTFWIAQQRTRARRGELVLRNEDLDRSRCRPAFATAMLEDLRWFGFDWQEGPDCGGPLGPYSQSERLELYRAALDRLRALGRVYPCRCSRQDVLRALEAPHAGDDEPIYPGTCRPVAGKRTHVAQAGLEPWPPSSVARHAPAGVNWRFLVPAGEAVEFMDGCFGPQRFVAGRDFGDFVVWRQDGLPAYQLACVVDDAAMRITEVVRGADLLRSAARQLLLYRAFGIAPPAFFHCPLVTDDQGVRLAKRHDALSLRTLRAQGASPVAWQRQWNQLADGVSP
jgi:glutamyl-tRNA synthetase